MKTLEPLLTPEDVAALLQVVPATVRSWLRAGILPAVKLPGRSRGSWRIHRADLEAFLAARETPARVVAPSAAAPAPAADPAAELDDDAQGEDTPPTEAERVAWASVGVPDAENPYTSEYRDWLAAQAAASRPEGLHPS